MKGEQKVKRNRVGETDLKKMEIKRKGGLRKEDRKWNGHDRKKSGTKRKERKEKGEGEQNKEYTWKHKTKTDLMEHCK